MRAREKKISMLIHCDIVQFYRKHTQNMTYQRKIIDKYMVLAQKKSLDRRRLQNGGLDEPLERRINFIETNPDHDSEDIA